MSSANQYVSGNGKALTTRKSSVAQTCNQLSLFLKEKGCLKDLNFGINTKFDDSVKSPSSRTTIDLLSNMDNSPQNTTDKTNDSAQMTIFYNVQVTVVNDITPERAKNLMLAAESYSSLPESTSNQTFYAQVQSNGLDLPIARRASLHKFFEKRKDRAALRAPYQLHKPSHVSGSSKSEHKFDLNL